MVRQSHQPQKASGKVRFAIRGMRRNPYSCARSPRRTSDLGPNQFAIEVIARADCVHRVGHPISRQRQHLIAQSLIGGDRRSSPSNRIRSPSVVPLTNSREEHEAGSEHRDETAAPGGLIAEFSVTANASARVTAPRSPPHTITVLNGFADLLTQNATRSASATFQITRRSRDQCAATSTPSRVKSCQPTCSSIRGTNSEAKMKNQ